LIARIYGIFTIRTNQFKAVDVVIMQNTAHLYDKSCKKFTFDLKGSSIGRRVDFIPRVPKNYYGLPVLKDTNFYELEYFSKSGSYRTLVKIDLDNYLQLQQIISKDSSFLASLGIMDYSLLLV
jgi:hypothetical protein